jgi:hypothetical protein
MTTIPPSSVPPPPGVSAPGAPTAPAGQSGAILTQVPPAVRAAVPGTVITGTVVGRDNQGQTLLQTNEGTVAFKTAAALTIGAQISLQIQTVGSHFQAVILSTLPGAKPGATTPGGQPLASGGTAAAPATTIAPSVSTGAALTATVVGPSGGPAPAATANAPSAAAAPPGAPATAATAATSGGAAPAPAAPGSPASAPGSVPPAATPSSSVTANPAPAVRASPSSTLATSPPATTSTPAAATPSALLAQQASASPTGASTAVARYAATPGGSAPTTTPTPAGATPGTTLSSPAASPSPTATGAPAPANPGAPLQQAPVGATVQLRIVPTTPGSPATPTTPGATPATAMIVAHTANGQTLVDTPVGRLTVTLPTGIGRQPIGSAIALEIVSVSAGTSAATPLALSNAAKALPTLGQEWPTLKAAMAALTAADPSFARQIMEVAMPRLGTARFLGQLLGQLTTGGGPADARALLGETATAILERAGRGDILARLDAELREMNRLNSSPSDWRLIFLPIADMSELRQLRVYTRKKKGGKGKERESSGRFIVEADFEAYGPLQLDGLVQKPRIDLIVRSHVEFTPSMQAGIAEVFGRTCDASGLIGKIFFNASPTFPVSPLDEITQAGPGLSV